MLYLKNTVARVKDHLFSDKLVSELQSSLVFQLLVLSSIKNYLYRSVTEEPLFVIPDSVRKNALSRKKVLVLDMDETLVYTRREAKPTHPNFKAVQYGGSTMYIEPRPYVRQFLEAVSAIFDVYVYTAGNKEYADAVLDELEGCHLIQRRFYRDCCKKKNGNYYKDLKHLRRVAKCKADMILVDDNAVSVGHNYPLALRVKEFEGQQEDRELLNIFQNLLKFYI